MKKKLINATANVLSAPKRAYYGVKAAKANRAADTIKKARAYDKMPSIVNGAPTEAFQARFMSEYEKNKLRKK